MDTHNTDIQSPADFRAGFDSMMQLHAEAVRRGWRVSERVLAIEIMRLERSAQQPRPSHTLPVLDRPLYAPDWYRGRAEALRMILQERRAEN